MLESAFNIVYGRPNRAFLRGKALASLMMVGSLVVAVRSRSSSARSASEVLKRYAPGFVGNPIVAYVLSVAVSLARRLRLPPSVYYVLTNVGLDVREVLPGAVVAAVAARGDVPDRCRSSCAMSKHNPVLQALGGPAMLLVWLYVMANVIVFGAEVNWWRQSAARRRAEAGAGRVAERYSGSSAAASACAAARAVRVLALPVVAELRDRPRLALRDEDRVVAEALAAARLARDRALEHARRRGSSSPSGESATSSQT